MCLFVCGETPECPVLWYSSTAGLPLRLDISVRIIRTVTRARKVHPLSALRLGLDLPPDPEIPNSRSPDSRFGRGRETGREPPIPESAGIGNREIPRFPIGRRALKLNREIGCEYSRHDPGLDVAAALSPSNADSGLPPPSFLNCQGPADGG